jgi:RNA polymerase sigma-70 factor (ECF subfamily)
MLTATLPLRPYHPAPQAESKTGRWFAQVVRDHYGLLFSIAYRHLGSADAAEDAVQTALLKAWRRLDQLDRGQGAAPWLCTIVRNAAIDMLRKGGAHAMVNLGDSYTLLADETPAAVFDHEDHQALRVIWEEVNKLTQGQSKVLLLRHREGLEPTRIAERLGLSPATVRVRLFRAYEKLRRNPRVRAALGMAA